MNVTVCFVKLPKGRSPKSIQVRLRARTRGRGGSTPLPVTLTVSTSSTAPVLGRVAVTVRPPGCTMPANHAVGANRTTALQLRDARRVSGPRPGHVEPGMSPNPQSSHRFDVTYTLMSDSVWFLTHTPL